jgi:uncharacterized membrane protein YccC
MTQPTLARPPTGLRGFFYPSYRRPPASDTSSPPWWKPQWSVPAALRAVRATLVVPSMLALTFKVIGDPQMAIFAVFGSFGALVLTTFGGTRRDKLTAHVGLGVAGSIALIIGTMAGGSAWLGALVTLPVAFVVYFAGVAGPNFAAGVTATLLAYVLPVASGGGLGTIPSRLEGWWLATAASTVAVLLLSPASPAGRLRRSAADVAAALGNHLGKAVDSTATPADRDASLAAKHQLITVFAATPYRPLGLATADQALGNLISLLEWCTALTCEAMDGHLDLSGAAQPDLDLLAESAAALRAIAALLTGGDETPSMERIWKARRASAAHLRGLDGDPATVRMQAEYAFHAQAIGVCTTAAAADALIATRRLDPDVVDAERRRWLAAAPGQSARQATAGLERVTRREIRAEAGGPGAETTDAAAGQATSAQAAAEPAGDAGAAAARRRPLVPVPGRSAIAADASIRSVWFRNSARGAAALALAVLVARLIGVQHAFWVVLGTLSVLRTSAGATGSTALRALSGTVLGFAVGAALLVGIGTGTTALWIALPVAVLVAAYAPGTLPFTVGQAAFTITVVVLFNILVPAGWQVGLLRVEDVAIGCAVSVVVGALFWPRGASALVGDNLAVALRAGAAYLTEATCWVLGLPAPSAGQGETAVAAGIRLDDALRGFLTEQGSKRVDKHDLRTLAMSALRLRLTAHSLASLPGITAERGPAAGHSIGAAVRAALTDAAAALAGFYEQIGAQVDRPGHGTPVPAQVPLPAGVDPDTAEPCTVGPAHYHPEALWVRDHLTHLGSHSADLVGPAQRLAALRRTPWWR